MQEARPGAASPEHLTNVLHRASVLFEGRVKSVAVESSRQMLVSRVMRLRLEVGGQDGTAPASVFFKTGRADGPISAEAIGGAEVDFYSRVAPLTPALRAHHGGSRRPGPSGAPRLTLFQGKAPGRM